MDYIALFLTLLLAAILFWLLKKGAFAHQQRKDRLTALSTHPPIHAPEAREGALQAHLWPLNAEEHLRLAAGVALFDVRDGEPVEGPRREVTFTLRCVGLGGLISEKSSSTVLILLDDIAIGSAPLRGDKLQFSLSGQSSEVLPQLRAGSKLTLTHQGKEILGGFFEII